MIPISRWGCVMNDFMKILGTEACNRHGRLYSLCWRSGKACLGIYDAVDAFKHIGEFVELILSITLAVQIFVRMILVNYYVLTGPVALACWALPGGSRTKGRCSMVQRILLPAVCAGGPALYSHNTAINRAKLPQSSQR